MSYDAVAGDKSIYAVYCAETQIITRMNVAHSCFVFASAKLNKKNGFGKDLARKKAFVAVCCSCCSKNYRGSRARPHPLTKEKAFENGGFLFNF
jgi:hypothetical protein